MFRRQFSSSSSALVKNINSATPQLALSFRHQGWHQLISNNHLHHPVVKQSDGVDDITRVKAEQQRWLDQEQYVGYSDTYLKQTARFKPQYELFNNIQGSGLGNPLKAVNEICEIVYTIYGEAAEILEELEKDPLHPQFAEMLATARSRTVALEKKIDEIYAEAHPTVKTMYDSMLVRRWQTLGDWIVLCEKKRADTINRLTPEWIDEVEKMRGIADQFKGRLKHLGTAMEANPVAFLAGAGFSDDEMVLIERRKKFFKKQTSMGLNMGKGDYSPH